LVLDEGEIISGYVRARLSVGHLETLEFGAEGDIAGVFSTLLHAVCLLTQGLPVKMYLAESERERLQMPQPYAIQEDAGLMVLPLTRLFDREAEQSLMRRNAINF